MRRVPVEVYTFKEGALSAVAHDLRLAAEAEVERVDDQLRARVALTGLHPVCARKDGRDDPGALSRADLDKIRRTLQREVLRTARFPEVRFTARWPEEDASALVGTLALHGVEREVRWTLEGEVAKLRLAQPEFGIKPYTALLGALRVRAELEVWVRGVRDQGATR